MPTTKKIPEHVIEAVRELAAQDRPINEIAFLTHLDKATVDEILKSQHPRRSLSDIIGGFSET